MSITPRERLVLQSAADVNSIERAPGVPHGVYRALCIRGLLHRQPSSYAITIAGREAIAA